MMDIKQVYLCDIIELERFTLQSINLASLCQVCLVDNQVKMVIATEEYRTIAQSPEGYQDVTKI